MDKNNIPSVQDNSIIEKISDKVTQVSKKLDERHEEHRADKKEKEKYSFLKTVFICLSIMFICVTLCVGIPRIIETVGGR